jgi:hypothetical protein
MEIDQQGGKIPSSSAFLNTHSLLLSNVNHLSSLLKTDILGIRSAVSG